MLSLVPLLTWNPDSHGGDSTGDLVATCHQVLNFGYSHELLVATGTAESAFAFAYDKH
jgi:hypothetical protein